MIQPAFSKFNSMKSRIILSFFALLAPILNSQISFAGTLTTKNYIVEITRNCEEGVVSCDNVTYRGISKQTGKAITLTGSTKHTTCADGITPCRFLGYEFKSDNITYLVLESGILQVLKGKYKMLLEERGDWK
jgi:hypothetical protein